MSDFLLIALTAGVVSAIIAKLSTWVLERRVTSLEFDLASLSERLLSEIRRRAGGVSKKNKELDEEILAAAGKQPAPPPSNQFWWAPHVNLPKG